MLLPELNPNLLDPPRLVPITAQFRGGGDFGYKQFKDLRLATILPFLAKN